MSLPAPNLDDLKFQLIVDEIKRKIGLRCREWTDHNVSDPGVTLIELFAHIAEMLGYRLDQVPEKNYIKFLEMLGISLEAATPATTELRFSLSRWIEDTESGDAHTIELRASEVVAATVRTDTREAIEFTLDRDLRMARPQLKYIYAVPAAEAGGSALDPMHLSEIGAGEPEALHADWSFLPSEKGFPIFSAVPEQGDALYLGFEANISSYVLALAVKGVEAAAPGRNPDYPSQIWEYWNSQASAWMRLAVNDESGGFAKDRSIELPMPPNLEARTFGGEQAYWVRCRYTLSPVHLPPRGPQGETPGIYKEPPLIRDLKAYTIGGIAPASNCTTVQYEELGHSDGLPGQIFKLRNAPILPRREGEYVLIGPQNAPREEMAVWKEAPDFALSGEYDRHFVCDSYTGEVLFGPNIEEPDGTTRQYGAVPPPGSTVLLSRYRYGGGVSGNVLQEQVRVLKSSIPYISEVVNVTPASGGKNVETLDRAKMRAREMLRTQERAVTAEDFEVLARKASPAVGRALCVMPAPVHSAGAKGERISPGVVKVLIVPALDRDLLRPTPTQLKVSDTIKEKVWDYLDQRRLLTAVLEVDQPDYVFVSTEINLVANPHADAQEVRRRVAECLSLLLHPLYGGLDGNGWIAKRVLTLADIYARVASVSGVAYLLDTRLSVARVVDKEQGLLGRPEQVRPDANEYLGYRIELGENEMFCSGDHRIEADTLGAVSRKGSR
jgi:predicted phage baseplate assembly protein